MWVCRHTADQHPPPPPPYPSHLRAARCASLIKPQPGPLEYHLVLIADPDPDPKGRQGPVLRALSFSLLSVFLHDARPACITVLWRAHLPGAEEGSSFELNFAHADRWVAGRSRT